MKRIASKQEFYKLSRQLLLGNILIQWTWEEFHAAFMDVPTWSEMPEIVGVRHVRKSFTNKGSSGLMPKYDAYSYAKECLSRGESPDNLLFDEGAVHDRLTIQGEVMPCERHLYLRYSHLQVHQRSLWHIDYNGLQGLQSFQFPFNVSEYFDGYCPRKPVVQHAQGLEAQGILQTFMDAPSWDKLNELFDEYENPVVEFACFDRSIGVLGWNTLFWELRTDY